MSVCDSLLLGVDVFACNYFIEFLSGYVGSSHINIHVSQGMHSTPRNSIKKKKRELVRVCEGRGGGGGGGLGAWLRQHIPDGWSRASHSRPCCLPENTHRRLPGRRNPSNPVAPSVEAPIRALCL